MKLKCQTPKFQGNGKKKVDFEAAFLLDLEYYVDLICHLVIH